MIEQMSAELHMAFSGNSDGSGIAIIGLVCSSFVAASERAAPPTNDNNHIVTRRRAEVHIK